MKRSFVIYTGICMIGMLSACKNETSWDGKIVIHPSCEVKADTITINDSVVIKYYFGK